MNGKNDINDFINKSNLPPETKQKLLNNNPNKAGNNVNNKSAYDNTKSVNLVPSSYITVNLHSLGKFSAPQTLHYKDYTTLQLNDLTLSNEHNTVENLVRVLNENCYEDFDCGNCTQEEFTEILATILAHFWRTSVDIPWLCDCQEKIKYDDERVIEKHTINLKEIVIYNVPDNVHEPITVEDEVFNSDTQELMPVKYSFRFTRINDVIYAKQKVQELYGTKQKKIDNFTKAGITKDELRDITRKMQRELDEEKLKALVHYTRAQCLTHINDVEIERERKYKEFLKIDPAITTNLFMKMDELKVGFKEDYELECSVCHEIKSRRLLFQNLLFVPADGQRKLGKSPVFVGI